MAERKSYSEKLKDPRWQRMRLQILERDKWTCQKCKATTKTLHVHHKWYGQNLEPWEYPPEALVTVCEDCHQEEYDLRPDAEHDLLMMLRQAGLWADEVHDMAGSLEGLRSFSPDDLWCFLQALYLACSHQPSKEAMFKIFDDYKNSMALAPDDPQASAR